MNKLNRFQFLLLVLVQCTFFSSSVLAAPSAKAKKVMQRRKAAIERRVKVNGWQFNRATSSELRVLGSDQARPMQSNYVNRVYLQFEGKFRRSLPLTAQQLNQLRLLVGTAAKQRNRVYTLSLVQNAVATQMKKWGKSAQVWSGLIPSTPQGSDWVVVVYPYNKPRGKKSGVITVANGDFSQMAAYRVAKSAKKTGKRKSKRKKTGKRKKSAANTNKRKIQSLHLPLAYTFLPVAQQRRLARYLDSTPDLGSRDLVIVQLPPQLLQSTANLAVARSGGPTAQQAIIDVSNTGNHAIGELVYVAEGRLYGAFSPSDTLTVGAATTDHSERFRKLRMAYSISLDAQTSLAVKLNHFARDNIEKEVYIGATGYSAPQETRGYIANVGLQRSLIRQPGRRMSVQFGYVKPKGKTQLIYQPTSLEWHFYESRPFIYAGLDGQQTLGRGKISGLVRVNRGIDLGDSYYRSSAINHTLIRATPSDRHFTRVLLAGTYQRTLEPQWSQVELSASGSWASHDAPFDQYAVFNDGVFIGEAWGALRGGQLKAEYQRIMNRSQINIADDQAWYANVSGAMLRNPNTDFLTYKRKDLAQAMVGLKLRWEHLSAQFGVGKMLAGKGAMSEKQDWRALLSVGLNTGIVS